MKSMHHFFILFFQEFKDLNINEQEVHCTIVVIVINSYSLEEDHKSTHKNALCIYVFVYDQMTLQVNN